MWTLKERLSVLFQMRQERNQEVFFKSFEAYTNFNNVSKKKAGLQQFFPGFRMGTYTTPLKCRQTDRSPTTSIQDRPLISLPCLISFAIFPIHVFSFYKYCAPILQHNKSGQKRATQL